MSKWISYLQHERYKNHGSFIFNLDLMAYKRTVNCDNKPAFEFANYYSSFGGYFFFPRVLCGMYRPGVVWSLGARSPALSLAP